MELNASSHADKAEHGLLGGLLQAKPADLDATLHVVQGQGPGERGLADAGTGDKNDQLVVVEGNLGIPEAESAVSGSAIWWCQCNAAVFARRLDAIGA